MKTLRHIGTALLALLVAATVLGAVESATFATGGNSSEVLLAIALPAILVLLLLAAGVYRGWRGTPPRH